MLSRKRFKLPWAITGFLAFCTILGAVPAAAQSSTIAGSWKLVSRTLPDGAVVKTPDLQGLMTFSHGYRHISVVFRTPDGKFGSFSALARFKISGTEYTETRMFRVFDDPSSGRGVDYQTSGDTKVVPVQKRGREVRIEAPFDPVIWLFEGRQMTATAVGGEFKDSWERVK
jgi:hypothetical protein